MRLTNLLALLLALPACGGPPERDPDVESLAARDTRARDTGGGARDSRTTPPSDCLVDPTAPLTGAGIGALRIGRRADDVIASCRVLRDTIVDGAEGSRVRVLLVDLGRARVGAEVDSGRIWRLRVQGPELRTTDSIGVGTTLDRLLALPGVRGAVGEGTIVALAPAHCGLSFRMVDSTGGAPAGWTRGELRGLPPTSRVGEVLVTGTSECPAR